MTEQSWYEKWSRRHGAVFGLGTDEDLRMFESWEPLFTVHYDPQELHAATNWLALHPDALAGYAPKAERHLASLLRRLHDQRAVALPDAGPAEDERGTCGECGGSGLVCVPHMAGVSAGCWCPLDAGAGPVYYTVAVTCRCPLGQWVQRRTGRQTSSGQERPPRMTLTDYELANPHWRDQLAAREAEQQAAARLLPKVTQSGAAGPTEHKSSAVVYRGMGLQLDDRGKWQEPEEQG